MEYPDWMMVAGAVLPVLGFIGFALAKTGRLRLGHGLRGVNEKPRPRTLGGQPGHRN
jgi:hypothetical protein